MREYQIYFPLYNFGYSLNRPLEIDIEKTRITISRLAEDYKISSFNNDAKTLAEIKFQSEEKDTIKIKDIAYEIIEPILKLLSFFQKAWINIFNYIIKYDDDNTEYHIKGAMSTRLFQSIPEEKNILIEEKFLPEFLKNAITHITKLDNNFKSAIYRSIDFMLENYETKVYEIKLIQIWTAVELLTNKISSQYKFGKSIEKKFHTQLRKEILSSINPKNPNINTETKKLFQNLLDKKGQTIQKKLAFEEDETETVQFSLLDSYALKIQKIEDIKTIDDIYSEISEYITNKLNNREPIRKLIKFLLKKFNIHYEEDIVKKAHRMRNNIMHDGVASKKDYKVEQPIIVVFKFENIVEQLILAILQGRELQ